MIMNSGHIPMVIAFNTSEITSPTIITTNTLESKPNPTITVINTVEFTANSTMIITNT